MAIPRLPFLWPRFLKNTCLQEFRLEHNTVSARHVRLRRADIHTSSCLKQESYAQRYGTAAEPEPPPLASPDRSQDEDSLGAAIEKEVQAIPKSEKEKEKSAEPSAKEPNKPLVQELQQKTNGTWEPATDTPLRDPSTLANELDASESHPKESGYQTAAKNSEIAHKPKPLETVLQMGAPTVEKPEEHRAPHLQAPPYVHHFDTFTLVRDLEKGGFSEHQSVTMMKAVRALLAQNLDMAKEGLVSKSDVENVNFFPFPPKLASHILCFVLMHPFAPTGNIPLPRRLLRTPHRNPQRAKILLHQNPHPTLPPPTHLRHPLTTRLPRNSRSQRRTPRYAERPPHGHPHADPEPGKRD